MNQASDERGSSGINVLWPILSNAEFQSALERAEQGESPNNISTILKYGLEDGVTMLWMGDLETDFMALIEDEIELPEVDVLFAPHHGRARVPSGWMSQMNPQVIVLGEAPAENLEHYSGRNHITQNSAGDITFECTGGGVHIYVSSPTYSVDFLDSEFMSDSYGNYVGSLTTD